MKEFFSNAEALGYALDYLVLVNPATYRNDPRYAAIIAKAKGDGSNDGFASGLLAAVEGLSYSAMFGMNAVREPEIALDHLKAMWEDFTYSGADENLKIMQGNIYGAVYDFQSKTTATGVALGAAWGATRLMRDYAGAAEILNGTIHVTRYGPTNPGPLPNEIAITFRSGTYREVITTESTTLYRVISDNGNPTGGYWTRTKPQGPLQSVIDSALDQNWGNTATRVVEMEVPPGTKFFEGVAAPQRGLVGGGNQIYFDKNINPLNPNWIKQ